MQEGRKTMTKHIQFDRETKDFSMYLDGEYVGSRATRSEAEAELDRLAFELLSRKAVA
jgi:hypothetical protein